jgi:hypothetical protein
MRRDLDHTVDRLDLDEMVVRGLHVDGVTEVQEIRVVFLKAARLRSPHKRVSHQDHVEQLQQAAQPRRGDQIIDGELRVTQQKNEVSGRYVVAGALKAALIGARALARGGSPYVFVSRHGKPYSYYGFTSIFCRAAQRSARGCRMSTSTTYAARRPRMPSGKAATFRTSRCTERRARPKPM